MAIVRHLSMLGSGTHQLVKLVNEIFYQRKQIRIFSTTIDLCFQSPAATILFVIPLSSCMQHNHNKVLC